MFEDKSIASVNISDVDLLFGGMDATFPSILDLLELGRVLLKFDRLFLFGLIGGDCFGLGGVPSGLDGEFLVFDVLVDSTITASFPKLSEQFCYEILMYQ